MSYTTDLIKNRRQLIDTGSNGASDSNVRTNPTKTYTSNLIQQRRNSLEVSQRNNTQTLPPLIVQPQVQPKPEKKPGLLSKVGGFVGSAFDTIFGDDEQILQSTQNDLINRINNRKESGKNADNLKNSLALVTEARDPNTSPGKKALINSYVRLARFGSNVVGSLTDVVSSSLDFLTQQSEQRIIEDTKLLRESAKKRGDYNEEKEKQIKLIEETRLKKQPTRDLSNKLKKWAEEFIADDPTFSEKVGRGVGSMATFALLAYATKGEGTVPYLLESVGEAGSSYEDLRNQGVSIEESSKRANGVLVANLIVNKFLNVFDDLGVDKGIKAIIKSIGTEGGQEGIQQIISNIATNKDWSEGVVESAIIGGILGGTVSVIFPTQTAETGIPTDPDVFINKIIDTDFAKTKEGQQLLKTALDAKNQGKQVIVNTNENGSIEITIGEVNTADEQAVDQGLQPTEITGNGLIEEISKEATNSLENNLSGQKEGSLERAIQDIENGVEIQPVEIRKTDEGNVVIVDGRHRLEASRQTNTPIEIVDVTRQFNKDYTGDLVNEIRDRLQQINIQEQSTKPAETEFDKEITEQNIKDINKPFNEETTRKTIDATLAGEREAFRLDSTENIKKYSQGLSEAKPDDTVIVYRAGKGDIGPGDFVTTSLERAEKEYIPNRPGSELLQKEVKLSDLTHGGGLKSEFVYAPKESVGPRKTEEAKTTTQEKPKVETSKKEVTKRGVTKELTEYYAEQDQEAVGQAWFEVMAELDIAEAGQKLFNDQGEFIGGISSTFPQWIPAELRIKTLFDSVVKDISDPTNLKFPPNSQPRKQELYEEVLAMIDSRAGTDSSDIIERIKNAREEVVLKQTKSKVKQKETTKAVSESTSRSEGTSEVKQKSPTVSSVESGLQTKGAVKIDNFELRKPPKKGTDEFKLYKKVEGLIRKYAQTVGEGYTPRGALGVYFQKTKNIRVNSMNDLSVASHEIAHFLDFANNITNKVQLKTNVFRELSDLYVEFYPGARPDHASKLKILEGYATLLQKYTEIPTTISTKYPTLVKEMLTEGGQFYHPIIGEILTDLNQIVSEYQELPSLDKISSKITSDNTNIDKESFLNFWQKLHTQVADKVYPVEVLAQKAGNLNTPNDPSLWVRAYNSISGIINNNISTDRGYWAFTNLQDGFQKKYDYNWKSLVDSVSNRGVIDDFASWLVARREHFSYQELDVLEGQLENVKALNKEIQAIDSKKYETDETYRQEVRDTISALDDLGVDSESEIKVIKDSVKALVEIAENKYNDLKTILDNDGFNRDDVDNAYLEHKDRFKDEAEMFDTLSKEDIEMLYNPEVQLINKKTYNQLKKNEGYASFKRQFYDEIVGESDSVGQVSIGGVKVSSLIKRKGSSRTIINPLYSALANHSEVMRKATKQIVYNQIGEIGVSGLLPKLFQEVQVKAIPDNRGRITFPQEKDSNIIMARKNYKRKAILVDKSIKQTVDNLLTYKNIDIFTQLYTGLSRTFTAGTTGLYPAFALTNFMVDQVTLTANTYNKSKPLYGPMKTMLTAIQNARGISSQEAKYYEEYLVMGGERQTFTGWQKLSPNDLFKRINSEKSKMEKAIDALNKGVDILSIPSAKSEIFSRATEYINARKAGKSQIVALEEAGRVTAPFHHIGAWGGDFFSTYLRGLPFFNAGIQVIDQTLRVASTKQGRARMSFVTMVITAGYLASILALMDASDDQKEQYKDLEPEELTNFIYFPNPNGQGLIRIKGNNLYSIPGTVINMIIANKMFSADYGARDVVEASTAFLPTQFQLTDPKNILSWIPQVFKPIAYTILNVKDYPRVSSLVSQSLSNLPARYQYNEGTSAFAKKLGEKLDISPIKIDFLLTGYFGRASGFLTGKPGVYNPASTIMRDYYFTMGRSVTQFYETKQENDGEYSAYQNHKPGTDEFDIDRVKEIYRVKIITEDMNDILTEYRKIDPEVDTEKASELRTKFFFLKEKLDDGTVPNNFTKWAKDADKRRNKNEE